jgi:hypothetical protein
LTGAQTDLARLRLGYRQRWIAAITTAPVA